MLLENKWWDGIDTYQQHDFSIISYPSWLFASITKKKIPKFKLANWNTEKNAADSVQVLTGVIRYFLYMANFTL